MGVSDLSNWSPALLRYLLVRIDVEYTPLTVYVSYGQKSERKINIW